MHSVNHCDFLVLSNFDCYLRMFQDLLGITNGVDTISFDGDCEDDDITEPIAPCTSLTPTQVSLYIIVIMVIAQF